MNKTENIIIRISPADKEAAKKKAAENQMSMSEYIVYLIRRDNDK